MWTAMRTIDISEVKNSLDALIDRAAKGEAFVIARAGKPLVKVVPLDVVAVGQTRRLGFLAGQIAVPDDFDRMGSDEIADIFGV